MGMAVRVERTGARWSNPELLHPSHVSDGTGASGAGGAAVYRGLLHLLHPSSDVRPNKLHAGFERIALDAGITWCVAQQSPEAERVPLKKGSLFSLKGAFNGRARAGDVDNGKCVTSITGAPGGRWFADWNGLGETPMRAHVMRKPLCVTNCGI
jgi:hypothetical protein